MVRRGEEALLWAVLQDANSAAPRLVYADWLEEHGEHERAEFIRMQCQRNRGGRPLQARKEQLLWVQYLGLALTWDLTITLFRWRLAEAIAWCRYRGALSLRTPALEPTSVLSWSGGNGENVSATERARIVNTLAQRRSTLLAAGNQHPHEPAVDCAGGRLLLFAPDWTLSDAAAEAESAFFDGDNVPAWDSWVWYEDEPYPTYPPCLVSWVPPHLVEQVDGGIAVNPEECIRWASDGDSALCQKLRAAGLLA